MKVASNLPAAGLPMIGPDGRMTPVWFRFFMTLFARTGGEQGATVADLRLNDVDVDGDSVDASVARLDRVSSDISLLLQTLPDDTRGPPVADQVNLDVALILHEAQDALTKATRALQDAMVEQATMTDVIRSMASQDASNVKITGGTIENTPIGATTRSTGRFSTVGVGTPNPLYRFVVSNNGAAGLEFDSDGAAYGAGTAAMLAYNRTSSAYVPLTITGLSVSFRATNTVRLSVDSNGIGFFGATPIAKPNVSGSRGGNAALASLLTSLAALGLISDGTTA